jgi:hypothetical protein
MIQEKLKRKKLFIRSINLAAPDSLILKPNPKGHFDRILSHINHPHTIFIVSPNSTLDEEVSAKSERKYSSASKSFDEQSFSAENRNEDGNYHTPDFDRVVGAFEKMKTNNLTWTQKNLIREFESDPNDYSNISASILRANRKKKLEDE